jgi:N utilization substance protein A
MATKKTDSINLIEIFKDFKEFKNIDKQTLINVLEESFRSVIAKMYGTDAN